jgi:beta-galactosidase
MIFFGADYYPEHWPEERWNEDAQLMAKAGFNVVRMAEFAWSKMEMREGEYRFDWLDKAIAILSNHGIQVVLGTPTASPPPWLMAKSEDLFLLQQNGIRQTYGLRREYCPNHPLYHQYSEMIITKMAKHYQDNPDVIGWQIDNEFGDRCFCDICQKKFQEWLQNRFETLDSLNHKWGTVFWSHIYTEWSQIPVPLSTIRAHNPGLVLDYYRFMSDSYCAFQNAQIEVIRQICPNHFITHNLMGFGYNKINYYDLVEDLDFVSWDNYPRMQWNMQADVDPVTAALSHDTMRGLKKKNYWVMEQQAGGGGWDCLAVTPKPGELRLWTYQSLAHGADGIVYFRWRTCRTGTEQYWQGILEHHGIPGRRYHEVAQIGDELKKVGHRIAGSTVKPKIAIMQSYDTRFAFQIQPNHPNFSYERQILEIYRGFYEHHISVEIVSERDPLTHYQAVIVPSLYILSDETYQNLEKFAVTGGVVVFMPRAGVKDVFNTVVNQKLPGLAAKMSGIEIEEIVSMAEDQFNTVQFRLPQLDEEFSVSTLADVMEPKGAEVIARYLGDFYAGKPAATVHGFGSGKVVYIGFMGDQGFFSALSRWMTDMLEIKATLKTPGGVEVVIRGHNEERLTFVLNHSEEEQEVELEQEYLDLLSGKHVSGKSVIQPYEVLILTER